jgi:hypothetical protein
MVNTRADFSLAAEEAVEDLIKNNPNHVVFRGCVSVQQKRNRLCSLGSSAFATFFNENNNDKFIPYVNFPDDAKKQKNARRNCTKQLQRLVKNDDDADVADVVNNNNNFTNLSNVDLTHDLSAAQSNPNVAAAAAAAAAPSADVADVVNNNNNFTNLSNVNVDLTHDLSAAQSSNPNVAAAVAAAVAAPSADVLGVNNTDTDYDQPPAS